MWTFSFCHFSAFTVIFYPSTVIWVWQTNAAQVQCDLYLNNHIRLLAFSREEKDLSATWKCIIWLIFGYFVNISELSTWFKISCIQAFTSKAFNKNVRVWVGVIFSRWTQEDKLSWKLIARLLRNDQTNLTAVMLRKKLCVLCFIWVGLLGQKLKVIKKHSMFGFAAQIPVLESVQAEVLHYSARVICNQKNLQWVISLLLYSHSVSYNNLLSCSCNQVNSCVWRHCDQPDTCTRINATSHRKKWK